MTLSPATRDDLLDLLAQLDDDDRARADDTAAPAPVHAVTDIPACVAPWQASDLRRIETRFLLRVNAHMALLGRPQAKGGRV